MKFICLALLLIGTVFARDQLEKVSVQMSWKYQFEYAGFIAAIEKGYYRNAGLEVELREYRDGMDLVSEVLSQNATYGVYNSSIIIEQGRLMPIVLLATYYQNSPLVFVARKGIKSPSDLIGKTIMGTRDELKYSSLALLMDHFGISPKNARFVDHTYGVDDFINGKVDAMSAFRSNELYYLDKAGIEYEVIDPAQYGFVMSAVNLFTSSAEATANTERTRRFIDATNQGWKYAIAHPDEIIDTILRKYPSGKTREALKYEAAVGRQLMMTDFYPIGEVNAELTTRAYKQLVKTGALRSDQKLGRFMFGDILSMAQKELSLTPAEKGYLLRKKKITMCVDPDWYPFEAVRDGKHVGIAADVIDHFETKLGIPIEMVPSATWNESVEKAKGRKCDIFSLASSTPERQLYMDFTSPYVTLPIVMATTADKPFTEEIASLGGKKLGAVKGYAITEKLKAIYPDLEIVEVRSITEGLRLVESGELYGYIDNLMVISSYIQKEYTGVLKVSSRLDEKVELGIGTRNDEPHLQAIFEKLVRKLDDPTMQQIYNRWVSTVEEVSWIDRATAWKLSAFVFLTLVAIGWRYYDLKRLNARLRTLSITDKLTGLANRQKIDEKLTEEKSLLERYPKYRSSVMLVDIDFFKNINDTYGHQAGDGVLCELAQIFKGQLRSTDTVGRWGGEEFLIVLPHTGLEHAAAVAENLRGTVQRHPFSADIPMTVSIGVAELKRELGVHENISRADAALYEAKASGRNRVCKG